MTTHEEPFTRGPWAVTKQEHPYQHVSGERGVYYEYGIATGWSHPQAKSPLRIVTIANSVCEQPGEMIKTLFVKRADAYLMAAAPDYHRQTDLTIGGLELLRMAVVGGDPAHQLLLRIDDLIRESKAIQAKATPA